MRPRRADRAPAPRRLAGRGAAVAAGLAVAGAVLFGCATDAEARRRAAAADAEARRRAAAGAVERGRASFYGAEFAGRRTASGERYDPNKLTAAHRTLPLGTRVRVTRVGAGEPSVDVRINDRCGCTHGRIIDLSGAAARRLRMTSAGVVSVRIDVLPP